ncbi:beta-1,3-glucan-binding protein-like [Liolophura sinensis]|uniref:beta-1,3-glucan-binding protein-like n=1 Tax=Liolophura sinensis TaxID=3198878 RepID=UPI00315967BE
MLIFLSFLVYGHALAAITPVHLNMTQIDGSRNERAVLPPRPVSRATLRLIFHDDFNFLDKNKWTLDATTSLGGHNEFEFYSPDTRNTYTRDGKLFIRPTLTSDRFGGDFLYHGTLDLKKLYGYCTIDWNNGCVRDANKLGILPPVMSSFLRGKTDFKYGKVEISARMPLGDWLWPALWIMPRNYYYGSWPRSGEMDFAETTGNINYGNMGAQRATASLHFGNSVETDKHLSGEHFLHGATYGDAFHKYTLDWTATYVKMYVDDILVYGLEMPSDGFHNHFKIPGNNIWGQAHNAPFDKDFYVIMNVAVGGTNGIFFDWVKNYPHPMPWRNKDSPRVATEKFWNHMHEWYPTWHGENAAMRVDYVKIWAY